MALLLQKECFKTPGLLKQVKPPSPRSSVVVAKPALKSLADAVTAPEHFMPIPAFMGSVRSALALEKERWLMGDYFSS